MKRTATLRNDRRVEKTRAALFTALLDLIVEKGYDRTSVEDILKRADVGRATFYAHYYNKEDLLLGRMTVFQLDVPTHQIAASAGLPDVSRVFDHVGRNRRLYLSLRRSSMLDAILATARNDLLASFRRWTLAFSTTHQYVAAGAEFHAQFLTGALIQLLVWWLDADMPESPRIMNQRFAEIAKRTIDLKEPRANPPCNY